MDLESLRQQRKQFNEQRRSPSVIGPATIGKRRSNGDYDVIFADGSQLEGKGVKVFDARHQEGDSVVAIPRQDGRIALEGPKAVPEPPTVFEDKCGNYLAGQLFTCPQPKKETIDVWALGLNDTGSSKMLYLLNLKTGGQWFLGSWPKNINQCPIDSPNDPPPPPTPPPQDPEIGLYRHHWQTSSAWNITGVDCNGGIPDPPYGRLVYNSNSISVLRTTLDITTGITWYSQFWTGEWLDANDNLIAQAGGVWYTAMTESPTPPALPNGNPCWSIVSGANASGGWQLQTLTLNQQAIYVSGSTCPTIPGPPGSPGPPRDPSKPPIPNTAIYTLSTDNRRRPIVRLQHTPKCKIGGYEFDGYFRLEGVQIKTYNGNSKMKDWRFDLPTFPCKTQLKGDKWINFDSTGRVWAWQAEPDKRPSTLTRNIPVEAFMTKSTIAADCTIPTGGEQPRVKYNAVYRGQVPNSLQIVSIAACRRFR